MLHVTNGSVALSRLHDLGMPGAIIPWDDVLHEGPVPAGLSDAELRRVRAEFLASNRDEAARIERSLDDRDERLRAAAAGDEIVLWFEHDLYDQLHVLQVLDLLSRLAPARSARVTAILADDYLTAQPDERLQEWYDARRELTEGQWQAAAAAWAAFRSPVPTWLSSFDHPAAWPWLRRALRRHLQQFPSARTGLSRTETQTLTALASGARPLLTAFRDSNHEVEEAIFMGDLGWWYHIRSLIAAPTPLVAVAGNRPDDFNHPDWWRDDEAAPRLALTEAGARVLAGESDRVALNGIDRWLGGVHLAAPPAAAGASLPPIWRWDDDTGALEKK